MGFLPQLNKAESECAGQEAHVRLLTSQIRVLEEECMEVAKKLAMEREAAGAAAIKQQGLQVRAAQGVKLCPIVRRCSEQSPSPALILFVSGLSLCSEIIERPY